VASVADRQAEHARSGYLFWGSTAVVILGMELLGVGKVQKWLDERLDITIPWPTISTTVGHLAERWSIVYVAVVGVIAAVGFYGLAYPQDRQTDRGRTKRSGSEPTPLPLYNSLTGLLIAVAAALGALVLFDGSDERILRGYFVWSVLAFYAVIIPSFLTVVLRKEAQFPTLFATFRSLRGVHPVVATVVGAALAAGLAILVFHLALYPWPNITNDSNRYAGLRAAEAREKAIATVSGLGTGSRLRYSTQTRGVDRGGDAWLVYFIPASGGLQFSGCSVAVTKEEAVPTPECSIPTNR
jgi:hypothetical protein